MRRRYFLLSGAGALAAVAGLASWRFACSTDKSAIAEVLHKKLDYLTLDEAGVVKYADDLMAAQLVSGPRLRVLEAVGPLYTHLALDEDNRLINVIRHGEDRVISQYLISSDFFTSGADVSRTVRYVRYYDGATPCGNPFARRAPGLAG